MNNFHNISEMFNLLCDGLERIQANNIQQGINTGFIQLDNMINGLHGGMLAVIAACPGMGATSLGLAIAKNVAITGKRVVYISLTTEPVELTRRLVSVVSGVELAKLQNGNLDKGDWKDISDAESVISKLNLHIANLYYDAQKPAFIDRLYNKLEKIDLLILDDIELIHDQKNMGWEFKGLAKALSVPVIVISKVGEALERRVDKRPTLADLPHSDLEEHADIISFLYRDDYYTPDTPYKGITELHIVKNQSKTGIVYLNHVKEQATFKDLYERNNK